MSNKKFLIGLLFFSNLELHACNKFDFDSMPQPILKLVMHHAINDGNNKTFETLTLINKKSSTIVSSFKSTVIVKMLADDFDHDIYSEKFSTKLIIFLKSEDVDLIQDSTLSESVLLCAAQLDMLQRLHSESKIIIKNDVIFKLYNKAISFQNNMAPLLFCLYCSAIKDYDSGFKIYTEHNLENQLFNLNEDMISKYTRFTKKIGRHSAFQHYNWSNFFAMLAKHRDQDYALKLATAIMTNPSLSEKSCSNIRNTIQAFKKTLQ